MFSQNETNNQFETQDARVADPLAYDWLKIEEMIRRAHEIHRERGGVFGYDLEDWLEAWKEPPERIGRT